MGDMVTFEDFRKKRCLDALLADIGLPGYCDECGEDFESLLLSGILNELPVIDESTPLPPEHAVSAHQPAIIIAFPLHEADRAQRRATLHAERQEQ